MNLLAIETSTEWCSLALESGGAVFARHVHAGQKHAEITLPLLGELLAEADLAISQVQGIAYGEGPGSFTGLRIGCGIVQGLALARNVPVVGVSTLQALAFVAAGEMTGDARVLACLDARMGEVYAQAWSGVDGAWSAQGEAGVFPPQAVPVPESRGWLGVGSGFLAHGEALARRFGATLTGVRPELTPTAAAVLELARPRFARGDTRDAAEALPIYLRDKVALNRNEQRAGRDRSERDRSEQR